ncbi:TolC family protein [Limnohabitans sp.]|uniref:TolC family protein n=1 Tax=Limnohabitans sp. TaxID=1907725 RepID=UPI0037C17CED
MVWLSGIAWGQTGHALPDLLAMAVTTHPTIQTQQALIGAAQQGVSNARWQYFPTPSLSAQSAKASSTDTSYAGDTNVTVLALTQPLWSGGRIEAGIDKAQAYAEAAQASLTEAQQQLAIRVVQAYGDWLSAHRKRTAFQVGQAQHIRLKDQVARRIQEGQAPASDLALAQSRLASLNADLAMASTQEEVSLARLSQLVGKPVTGKTLSASLAEPLQLSDRVTDLLTQAQSHSPTLARARSNAQAQLATIQEAKSATLPEVSLRLENQRGNFNYSGSAQQSRAFINVTSRLGAGLSSFAAVNEAVQRHAAALAEIESQQRSLAEQITTDHALLVTSQSRRQALQQSAELADQVLASWDRQYLSGRKSWQDLMNSAREQVQVQAQIADLEGSQLVASWRLALITGQLQISTGQLQIPTGQPQAPTAEQK